MKEIAPWIGAAILTPLFLLPTLRSFHRNPEIFGWNVKPQSATAAVDISRNALLTRAAACKYSVDISKADDKKLNDLVYECEKKK